MKAYERMNATNDICRKWLGKRNFTNFKLFKHTIGSKDYQLEDELFDGFAFKDKAIWFMQFKTNGPLSKKSTTIRSYILIEKKYNVRCAWLSYNTKKRELTIWTTETPTGEVINK